MRTDKKLLLKGVKYLFFTLGLMFMAPVVLYQAFKNQGHPFYLPVLITGLLLAVGAIGMGFYSIRVMMNALFGDSK